MIAPIPGIAREHMDQSASPCEDLFRHANGGWLDRAEIPPDQPAWGVATELRERNLALLVEVATSAAGDSAAPRGSALRLVGDFFASGMDEDAIEVDGLAALAVELAEIERLASDVDLAPLLARLHARSVGAGFHFAVQPDAKDSSTYLAQLAQGGLGLPDRDYYLKEDERSAALRREYAAHVARMLRLAGAGEDAASAQAASIFALELRLARASMDRVTRRDPYQTYHKTAVARLREAAAGFAWDAYLEALGAPALDVVNVRQPAFFDELARAAREVPLAEWKTYLRWHLVRAAAPYLGAALFREWFAFSQRTLLGVREPRPRVQRVALSIDEHIGEALGRLYVARAFRPAARARMAAMVEDVRAVLEERIRALEWMSEPTKEEALRKLAAFRVKVGHPDVWRDYSALEIDRGSYARNVLRARVFEAERNLAKLGRPVDREEWHMSPPTVNAYHNPSLVEIVLPAGRLQPPFFDPDGDDATNYGGTGMVIGHEIIHGFDDQGRKYDATGALRDWWRPEDEQAYVARAEHVVRQYEGYEPLPGQRINGRLTLGENIADIGGLAIAFAAYRRALARNGAPPSLDGFTPEQRFFLAWAQAWRRKVRDEALRVQLAIDPHSPSSFRVLGPVEHLPEFAAAFGCDEATTAERPTIW